MSKDGVVGMAQPSPCLDASHHLADAVKRDAGRHSHHIGRGHVRAPGHERCIERHHGGDDKAHPALTSAQRRAIELDYGMRKGTVGLQVRAALTYYACKRLGLDRPPDTVRPQDQQIVLENRGEVEAAMQEFGAIPGTLGGGG
jgi:hypothetical protein